jgi:hypothetical protein
MSFGLFLVGAFMMFVGIMMVWKTAWFDNNWGDIGAIVGIHGSSLTSWKLAGVIVLFVGFLVGFGILEAFFHITVGQFLPTGFRE